MRKRALYAEDLSIIAKTHNSPMILPVGKTVYSTNPLMRTNSQLDSDSTSNSRPLKARPPIRGDNNSVSLLIALKECQSTLY